MKRVTNTLSPIQPVNILRTTITKEPSEGKLESCWVTEALQQLKSMITSFHMHGGLVPHSADNSSWNAFKDYLKIKLKLFQPIKAVESQNGIVHLCLMSVIAIGFILLTACPGNTWHRV